MQMMLTAELLRKAPKFFCSRGVDKFERAFPNGVPVSARGRKMADRIYGLDLNALTWRIVQMLRGKMKVAYAAYNKKKGYPNATVKELRQVLNALPLPLRRLVWRP